MRQFKKIELLKLLLFNSLLFGGSGLLILVLNSLGLPNLVGSSYGLLISVLVPFLLIMLIFLDKTIEKRKISEYGLKPPKPQHLNIIFYSFLAVFPVAFLSRVLTPSFDVWYSSYLPVSNLSSLVPFILIYVPLGVILEEVGERALFQSRLSQLFGSKAAVYVATLNFVALHIPILLLGRVEYQFVMLLTFLVDSLLLSLIFEYTQSIYSTLLLHFLINLFASIQVFLHLNSLLVCEVALWSLWAALFVMNLGNIIDMFKKIKFLKQPRIRTEYEFYLSLLALPYPIFLILSVAQLGFILPLLLLLIIAAYYMKEMLL